MALKPVRRKQKLPPLTPVQQQIMDHVFNSIAFQDFDRCCAVEELAEQFQRTTSRLMPTLRKLAAKGYLKIEGETYPLIVPTIEALRQQDPQLTEDKARAIIARIRQ
jgi:hypothetical protein